MYKINVNFLLYMYISYANFLHYAYLKCKLIDAALISEQNVARQQRIMHSNL